MIFERLDWFSKFAKELQIQSSKEAIGQVTRGKPANLNVNESIGPTWQGRGS